MWQLRGQPLALKEIAEIASGRARLELAPAAMAQMEASRRVVRRVAGEHRPVYGINTGFGKLCEVRIADDAIERLQLNLVRSHACGLGRPLSPEETRVAMALRANTLALGYSGVRPLIPEKGSVGASGDRAPLAHLALAIIGEGEVDYQGRRWPSREALRLARIEPVRLEAKEGLALLNGTQALTAAGGLAVWRAWRVVGLADVAGAMSFQALLGTPVAFDERIHAARPHAGQVATAARLRRLLEGSDVETSRRKPPARVQDAYSLRCTPQVHGAVRGALESAREAVETEAGSATDNPLVFAETGDILSGGNFHGAPLALVFDSAAIAMTTLAGVGERRIDRLVNPDLNDGLPAFLASDPGLSSGFMIAQVVAASLLNESKVLAHPASVDSLPTSGGQEDHVSMGMTAATKLRAIVENAEYMVAIELLTAAEALRYREPFEPGPQIRRVVEVVRSIAPPLAEDRPLSVDIEATAAAIRQGRFDEWAFSE